MKTTKYQFEWDEGNNSKSLIKHGISNKEAESGFYDNNRIIKESYTKDEEIRYICIGISDKERIITTAFTVRNGKIRPISSRISREEEKDLYFNKGR